MKWTSKRVQFRVLVMVGDTKKEALVVEDAIGLVCVKLGLFD